MMNATEAAAWLRQNDDYLIITHRRPDGDTLGSGGALVSELRQRGKSAYMLINHETTSRFIDLVSEYWAPEGYEPKNIISVDTASPELLPENAEEYLNRISLCIDHHISNRINAAQKCVDSSRAACGELMYDILIAFSGKITPKTAGCLYAAVATDTGCFVYANTTAGSHKIASNLISTGAPHRDMNKLFFRTKTISRVKLEAMIFSSMEFHFDGAAAIAIVTHQMLEETNASEDDLDDVSALPGVVDGVICAVTIRELEKSVCKVSVRTQPEVNANEICSQFGGGGHAMAAGATVEKTSEETRAELLSILEDVFNPSLAANV
jgi:phosphoesterase RecJ-like protein